METKDVLKSLDRTAAALTAAKTSDDAWRVGQGCNPIRVSADNVLAECVPTHALDKPPRWDAAMLAGAAAVAALDEEVRVLRRAKDQLDRLEAAAYARAGELKRAENLREFPKAVKRVPALVEHLREAMANFEAAVAAVQSTLGVIGEAVALPGVEYPFTDDQLVELLELRNRVWTPRVIAPPHAVPMILAAAQTVPSTPRITIPAEQDRFPRSRALLYETKNGVVRTRRPPSPQSAFADPRGD